MKRTIYQEKVDSKPVRKRSYLQQLRRQIEPLVAEFKQRFPDERACWQFLLDSLLFLGMIVCSRCDGTSFSLHTEKRNAICDFCGKARSVTAGTFFHKVKKLPEWLLAIWLIENGAVISSNAFAALFGMAQSSCWHIFLSVFTAKDINNANRDPLLSSNHFRALFVRRTDETPRAEHPRNEENFLAEKTKKELADLRKAQSKARPKAVDDTSLCEMQETQIGDLSRPEVKMEMPTAEKFDLTGESKVVFESLTEEALTVDEVCKKTDLPAQDVLRIVTILELQEIISQLAGFKFKVKLVPVSNADQIEDYTGSSFTGVGGGSCDSSSHIDGALKHASGNGRDNDRGREQLIRRVPLCLNLICKACDEEVRSELIDKSIGAFQKRVEEIYHGIGRKYLRPYVAGREFILKRSTRKRIKIIEKAELPNLCLMVGYIGGKRIRRTSTELLVDWDVPAAG